MYKIFNLIIVFIFTTQSVYADKAADKAEFNKLYSEYIELYQNSDNLNIIIEAAEKVYNLAPRIYGRKSENYAISIYNLAELYDKKGGEEFNKDEEKASVLYKKYFRLQNLRKAPKNITYLNQYLLYMTAYYNAHPKSPKLSIANKVSELAGDLNLTPQENADIEFIVGVQKGRFVGLSYAEKNFHSALKLYNQDALTNKLKIGETLYWLSKIDLVHQKHDEAEHKLIQAIEIIGNEALILRNNSYKNLAIISIRQGEIDKAKTYYKQIYQSDDPTVYLIPLHKPNSHFVPTKLHPYLRFFTRGISIKFDISIDGFLENVKIVNGSFGGEYDKHIKDAAAAIRYLPPMKQGKPTIVKDQLDLLYFRTWSPIT